ncbi:MAG: NAD(P)-dependent glycerol-3-phosphate dehydrogenase [Gemmatimonadales bacterium]|nr:MAG: NAD(P)-dependent glycerol-3-phosphate dehydrogenase [Gemmatimonadales bacterium]
MKIPRVAVLGAGSWGTALGDLLARNGHDVSLWTWSKAMADELRQAGCNERFLPGVCLSPDLTVTNDMGSVLEGADFVLSVSPSHRVRSVVEAAAPFVPPNAVMISASKGFELDTDLRMTQVIGEVLGPNVAQGPVVLSGPSFAAELARHLPTAVTLASSSSANAESVQRLCQNDHFRLYTQPDVIGTEVGGSLKNVMAIAAGISDGLGLGANARAALLTRGLAEMSRLAERMGGQAVTLAGLAGMGDLVLTCTGDLSRNRRVGLALGSGLKLQSVLAEMTAVAEGVRTTRAARDLAQALGVEMPIVDAVYSVLYEGVAPVEGLARLMSRDPKPERWS